MARLINRIGKIYGHLEVIKRLPNEGSQTMWLCKCLLCGNFKKICGSSFHSVFSCGCLKIDVARGRGKKNKGLFRPYKEDLTGRQFEHNRVLSYISGGKWLCECGKCKAKRPVLGYALTHGLATQCRACMLTQNGQRRARDLTGVGRGKLVFIMPLPMRATNRVCWLAVCDCGRYIITGSGREQNLSCGFVDCAKKDVGKKGHVTKRKLAAIPLIFKTAEEAIDFIQHRM